jgi:rhodanese-related sulfurtransferase
VPLDSRFAEFAGDVARPGEPIVIVADPGREDEARVRLARIGFDTVRGALLDIERVLADRPALAATSLRLSATDLHAWRQDVADLQILDVRNPGEQVDGVIPGARSMPLPTLLARLDELDRTAPTVVYCATGVRSSIAASLLREKGFLTVADVLGGYPAWAAVTAA